MASNPFKSKKTVNIGTVLAAKEQTLVASSEAAREAAAWHADEASRKAVEAKTAEKQAAAVAQASNILAEAGVTA